MALTGLQIYKLLPQTNCKECDFPTCLAFAMKLAAKQVSLDLCPYASDEAKAALGAASVPPIRKVTIGGNDKKLESGEEVVLFRHDKTFYHPTILAMGVSDDLSADDFDSAVKTINEASYDRAGETIAISMIALFDRSNDTGTYTEKAKRIAELSDLPVAIISEDPQRAGEAVKALDDQAGFVYCPNKEKAIAFAEIAKTNKIPIILNADYLDNLAVLAEEIASQGVEDILLDPGFGSQSELLKNHTLIRRMALDKTDKGFGYPSVIRIPDDADPYQVALAASLGIAKYAGIVIFPNWQQWQYLPLLTLRQNIYTDPQKPLQVEGGIYSVGEPDSDSPVYVTTNFSLTYFMLSSEVEASGEPAHLVIVDAEGMSVLTAWSAGKFGGELVGKAVLESGIADKVNHRKVIIPGYVAVIKGEMEDAMPGWDILVGPQEASDVPAFVKDVWLETSESVNAKN
ncbi:acetyl-CoA decarbonylase/synthase complex subunit gamma [candidate division LCP-89 bacterium B3_LCP]|uniref:Acetyl-CoA decarbonylase/synthase complex subunit gamma n=1 Tax=candidate division LCP-89 bacterium B3_LCP TaxID=2012998 RepID=A0A532UPY0_UNCL8|nr:MAG: acetyl-CoA decarbonylase/synthase complex subunit gamma [candidate division LCP-89 bacterium B3_LCP]